MLGSIQRIADGLSTGWQMELQGSEAMPGAANSWWRLSLPSLSSSNCWLMDGEAVPERYVL